MAPAPTSTRLGAVRRPERRISLVVLISAIGLGGLSVAWGTGPIVGANKSIVVVLVVGSYLGGRWLVATVPVGRVNVRVLPDEFGMVLALATLPSRQAVSLIAALEIVRLLVDRKVNALPVLTASFGCLEAWAGLVGALSVVEAGGAGRAWLAISVAVACMTLVSGLGAELIDRALSGRRSVAAMSVVISPATYLATVASAAAGVLAVALLMFSPWSLLAALPLLGLLGKSASSLVEVQGRYQRVSLGRKFLAALNRADDDDHASVDEALEEFRELLNVSFVTLVDTEGEQAARALAADLAEAPEPETVVELTHESQPLGRLLVGAKRNGQPFDETDQETLESNAGQLATWLAKWKLAAQVEYMATHDQLTGLLNRIGLDRAIMADADTGITKGAVMLLDLDNFRQLNDTLGHHAGDELLELVADRIRSIVGPKTALARLGGDEFAVWIPLIDDDEMAKVAKDVLDTINEPVAIHENPLHIEGSVGVVLYPDHGDNTTDLIRRADVAMYIAKDAHLGVMRYDPAIDPHSSERLRVLGELRDALNEGALVVHYQPKYELETNRIVGVESLVRWQQRDGTMVPPGKFIDAAERSGLIGPIFEFVLRTSLLQIRTWDRMGMQLNASVNMSARNLADPTIIETIERALVDYGVPAGQLTIELTERDLPANSNSAAAMLNYLTSTGIKVSLDDFGTGQQSYVHLTQLPIDEIKIDQTFVKKIASSPLNQGIVESLVHVARRGRLHAVAEGIEDAETLDLLREMGCQYGQGYHLCRPAGAEVITEVIVNNHAAIVSAV